MFTVLKSKPKSSRDFDSIRIKLASPERIREWSYGEVKKAETINYRTFKPERDGLFCAKIFGPMKDYECLCGKYKRIKYKGIVCEKCGVEVTESRVRRERMGHIELAVPVVHIWYLKSVPSMLSIVLDMKLKDLERIVYYEAYVVVHSEVDEIPVKTVLTETAYKEAIETYGIRVNAEIGAQAIYTLLKNLDLDKVLDELKEEYDATTSDLKKKKIMKRAKLIEKFKRSQNKPEWMVLKVLPVLPPDLRPLVSLEGGRFASSDLNDLYRRIINRNNRLKRLLELGAPSIIVRNEMRMLQEAVDALIDNGRRKQVVRASNNRPLKSLSDTIKGKEGRFRRNLLGKRVDYSGRSVIVAGPDLRIDQCGLPKIMAYELFKPFIYNKLIEEGHALTVKNAKKIVEDKEPIVWDLLEDIVKEYPVMLNRAPTLHRISIQSFYPVLTDEKAIRLHPLVCAAFNADFDGDQMAVHVPISVEAQLESKVIMLSSHNIISPAHGNPIAVPSQDMVLGIYYMTKARENAKGESAIFANAWSVRLAYENGVVDLNAKIKYKVENTVINTTVGRVLFSEIVPKVVPFSLINKTIGKKDLNNLISYIYKNTDLPTTVAFLDDVKKMGFEMATKSGISISVDDILVPEDKSSIIEHAEEEARKIQNQYEQGLLTDSERYNKIVDLWNNVTEEISKVMMLKLGGAYNESFNPIFIMADSGARGSLQQMRQLAGIRGLMTKPSGDIIETPIKSNFKEGLNVIEYFVSTHGARKGLADTALKTANAGYLTRKLIDVAQDVFITIEDCGTTEGLEVSALIVNGEEIESLQERIVGRIAAEDIISPLTQELIVKENQEITEELAEKIVEAGIRSVKIFSVLTCKAKYGVCAKCYGRDLARGRKVEIGEAVGIIAAQSIGEPGTQLTLRTFHVGGTALRAGEKVSAETKKGGIVKYFNLRTSVNSENNNVILSRRDAAVLIIEPQIVSESTGLVNIEQTKTDFVLKIDDKESYNIRKIDFINEKDIIQNDANVVGKLIFNVENGQLVKEGDLLVGRILEVYTVPKNLPYGARIYLKDNDTIRRFIRTSDAGIVKFVVLKGQTFVEVDSFENDIVDKHGAHIIIEDENATLKKRYYLSIGSKVFVKSKSKVKAGDIIAGFDDVIKKRIMESDPSIYLSSTIIADWDSYTDFLLVDTDGYVRFVDIVNNVTLRVDIDKITGLKSNIIIESKNINLKPRIEIVDENGNVKISENTHEKAEYYLPPGIILQKENGDYVRPGDAIGKIPREATKTTDITGGLPRLNDIFEAKKPKDSAVLSEISGVVSYEGEIKGKRKVVITSTIGKGEAKKEYLIPRNKRILVYPGDRVQAGDPLTDGIINPHDILRILGEKVLRWHLVNEIQQVYKMQGVSINDKHIEIIVKQMLSKIIVEDSGDTDFIEGDLVDKFVFERKNQQAIENGKKPAIGKISLLGITKASLNTDSFISAASFQETVKVLTDAAISGSIDSLRGLKENVIVGRLIPVGTGQKRFDDMNIEMKILDK
ncbi:DNA-directed RNA polymerase subunit beta' [Desulfurella multipotens]|uniref:DNA-directed RNA polymerase subunit beta' n=1 Tax=Desulfurella multipotens TaxID=79269 RepID=A0A1G6RJ61_9BACT|nr:DNA-directed RNA polymerase subunit beta' [Desulfurella multipotens]SDD04471.1 DNA-directed RNA polymerase subunit beta' [Desulfurella multipotens]